MASLVRTVAPADPPVTLVEGKAHLRVDHSTDDTLITGLLTAATEYAEGYTGLAFVTQTWEQREDANACLPLLLKRAPLIAITGVQYVDADGTTQTLSSALYRTVGVQPASLYPAYSGSWPSVLYDVDALRITFTAGFGDADDVPQALKQAVLMLAAHWYERREPVSVGAAVQDIPFTVKALLDQSRVFI